MAPASDRLDQAGVQARGSLDFGLIVDGAVIIVEMNVYANFGISEKEMARLA